MPQVADEEGNESPPTSSSFSIIAWWRKFHFSGRVIACSVLLGLGLVLIGGLIFAINLTDGKSNDTDSTAGEMPTKAPSNYTGPVVMGIGGFIVVIGVIMCLFETQVCRKKTGDSSPLIAEKTDDPERRGSDPAPGASTSHGHKSRKHGARKNGTSPKKSKSRHAKSRSKERSQGKSPSPKSPPVPIHPSKNFMTSSEDSFLTPPNTLDENATVVKNGESRSSEPKHSALMKSFTSSDPSWNQSAEFLTPSTSFRDTSVSLNNSVEIDKNHDEKELTTTELSAKQNISPEYMTPLTVEEDRIQQLLIRVKNEQKQMAESKKESNVDTNEYSRPKENFKTSQEQMENVTKDNEVKEMIENDNSSSKILLPESSSASKDSSQEPTIQVEDADTHELSENNSETNASERNLNVVQNVAANEISEDINADESKISPQSDSTLLTNENKDPTLVPEPEKEASHGSVQGNDGQGDLDSSVSSDETVVSPDSFQENANHKRVSIENATSAILKENSNDESKCLSSISESPADDTTAVHNDSVEHSNNEENFPQKDEAETDNLNLSNNKDVKTEAYGIEDVKTEACGIEDVKTEACGIEDVKTEAYGMKNESKDEAS